MIDSSVDYKNLPRPTWAEIDIDAILNNINEYKKALGNKVEIIVAAKGNGYGHGMLPIVRAINELDIYGFATGNMYEAIEMRKHGIDKPIQLFAHNFPETAQLLVKYDLMPSFVKPGDAKAFADALGKDVALKVWVKCDTGLGRLGLLPEEVLPELEYIRNETSFKIEGLYSHIGPTDSDKNPKKDEYNEGQISCFNKIIADIEAAGFEIPRYQLSSTYATQRYEKAWYNTVCIGTGVFANAKPQKDSCGLKLKDCLKGIHSRLISKKTLKAGSRCLNMLMENDCVIGVIPFGSCDGFSTRNAGGEVLLNGVRCKILAVCLEHTVLDITDVPDAEIGDVVTLLGQNGESRIDVSEYCERLGITVIEFWCSLSFHSFPHIYVREGQPQEEVIYSYNK